MLNRFSDADQKVAESFVVALQAGYDVSHAYFTPAQEYLTGGNTDLTSIVSTLLSKKMEENADNSVIVVLFEQQDVHISIIRNLGGDATANVLMRYIA